MPKKSARHKFGKYIVVFWILVALPIIGLCTVLYLASKGYIGEELPSFEELENPKSNLASEVISEDHKVLGTYFVQNRTFIGYDKSSVLNEICT